MSRRTREVTISTAGRDKGKTFLITEMPASQAESWGVRAVAAMGKGGLDISEGADRAGLAGVAALGVRALFASPYEELKPLMDEMFGCVEIVETAITRPPMEEDIEEVMTRMQLRDEVLNLHLGFSLRGILSDWIGASRKQADEAGLDISTSHEPSEPSSLTA